MIVENRSAYGSPATSSSTAALNNNQVDMELATLTVGESSEGTNGTMSEGTFTFNEGTVFANTIDLGVNTSAGGATGAGAVTGTINVDGGTLVAGSGGISLGNVTG